MHTVYLIAIDNTVLVSHLKWTKSIISLAGYNTIEFDLLIIG